jgi:hypothetical protein
VSEGDTLEFSIVNKPKRPEFTLGSSFPLGINISDIRALSILITDNFTLQPIFNPIPPESTNFTVSIVKLEETDNLGIVNISYQVSENISEGRSEYQLPLNNLFGEPIISTDWQNWIQLIDSLSVKSQINGKKVIKSEYTLTNQTFKTSIIFKPTIPDKLRFYITNVNVNQTICYYTNTGIQAYMAVISTYSIFFIGDITSVLCYKYVGENFGSNENISIITRPFNPLQIIIPAVGGMIILLSSILIILLIRKRLK